MKLKEYLNKKNQSSTEHRDICLKCFRPSRACFCKDLEPFHTNTYFVFLMHPLEAKRSQIGTGRLTHLGLKNSEIIVDKDFDKNERFNELISIKDKTQVLLYPGADSINLDTISKQDRPEVFNNELMIFIVDATWPCAKSMVRDTLKLHDIPKICFENKYTSNFDIKHQPAKYCLSTIESTYYLLSKLELLDIETDIKSKKETLLYAFKNMVEFHKKLASDPSNNNYHRTSNPVKERKERAPSKKWEKRSICFNS